MAVQEGMIWLQSWADDNELTFNTSKSRVVHLRHVENCNYNLSNSPLKISQVERDL